jgi:hypothetical protein
VDVPGRLYERIVIPIGCHDRGTAPASENFQPQRDTIRIKETYYESADIFRLVTSTNAVNSCIGCGNKFLALRKPAIDGEHGINRAMDAGRKKDIRCCLHSALNEHKPACLVGKRGSEIRRQNPGELSRTEQGAFPFRCAYQGYVT